MRSPAGRWTLAAVVLAAAIGLGLSWCILHSPLTLNDGLGPILDSRRAGSTADVFRENVYQKAYFRPLRMAQIKAVFDLRPADPTPLYKLVHAALAVLTCILFALLLRPRSAAEFAAAAIAVTVLVGHHSFFMLIAEAYPINHFLEIVALAVATALLTRGAPAWWKDVLAIGLLAIGLLTLESAVLMWVAAATCWIVGWRGVSGRAVLACSLLLAAYFWIRVDVLAVGTPALDERAAGFGFSRLEPDEIVARFQANPLPFYAYNVASAFSSVLLSQPRDGMWADAPRWVSDETAPRMWVHLTSSAIVTVALIGLVVGAGGRWRRSALDDRDRLALLALAMVAANAVISYGYVKDEVLSVGSTFYAAGAYAVGARLLSSPPAWQTLRRIAAAGLIAASLLWTSRAAGCFYSLRAFAFRASSDWGLYSLERDLPRDAADPDTLRLFLTLRSRAIGLDVPNPQFTNERSVQRFVEIQ